ncbi:MAG: aminoglycoside 6-adenylyltransferase [Oscillospiraceae bacterium]
MTNEQIFDRLIDFAEKSGEVRALVLFGSRARTNKICDEYSDYDILMFVNEPEKFLHSDGWLCEIAKPEISFIEQTFAGGMERRVYFSNALDMDFIIFSESEMSGVLSDDITQMCLSRGWKVIVDKCGCSEMMSEKMPADTGRKQLSESEFENTVSCFWFHTIWAYKKLMRGERWAAKMCIDAYLKTLLLSIAEYKAAADYGENADTWHDGRFFDEWADSEILSQLDGAFGGYTDTSLITALKNTMDIFSKAARSAAQKLGFHYPEQAERFAYETLKL